MAPAASSPVAGAQKTIFAAGRWDGGQLTPFTRREWTDLSTPWNAFAETARTAASTDFKHIEVSYKRNKRNVIEYAEVTSMQGLVASAILAPEFSKTFSDTLGDVLLVAVPSRTRAYVFPEFGGNIARFSPMVWDAYRETSAPVSVELFEIRKGALRAVGLFDH